MNNASSSTFQNLSNGVWAGLLATGPMTLAMFRIQRSLPELEKSPLPPATITSQVTKPVADLERFSSESRKNMTMVSHLAYGAGTGAAYALVQKWLPLRPLNRGIVFGLAVWAGSYLGWIPAAGLRASAFRMPARRNALMILAHVIWGASLGFAESELRHYGRQMLDGERRALLAE